MKITYMLKRENFYEILMETLTSFYGIKGKKIKLVIYPKINAIVTTNPSKDVRDFLYTEFNVGGSLPRRLAVKSYIKLLLHTGGMFSAKNIVINGDVNNDSLIYPCNKKIRIFQFDKNIVSVIKKDGFPDTSIQHEIQFRLQHKADFIWPILDNFSWGYTESIINGFPLARLGKKVESYSKKAFKIWCDYTHDFCQSINAKEYSEILFNQASKLHDDLIALNKEINSNKLLQMLDLVQKKMSSYPGVVVTSLSHGDFQPGNIWVEKGSNKIIIIDWESTLRRSIWYDKALLFDGLRLPKGFQNLWNRSASLQDTTVLFEDLIYLLEEQIRLPEEIGIEVFNTILEESYV